MTRPGELALLAFGACGFVVVAVLSLVYLLVWAADQQIRKSRRARSRRLA